VKGFLPLLVGLKRMRVIAAAIMALCLSACATSSNVQSSSTGQAPPERATVLVVAPDIQLSILTAAGLQEPRADWSSSARENVAQSLAAYLTREGHTAVAFAPDDAMEGRSGQLLRLHEAVAASILMNNYAPLMRLPTKATGFDWTLGDGVQEIAAASDAPEARYALFLYGRGSYSSSARAAAVAIGLILGVGLPTGGQQMYVSLVDLQTGQILWFNVAQAGVNADMRDPAGATTLVDSVMESAPL